ncbi:nudix hydrolase 15, mitochondrial-like [Actinidia eriantha]|uniref:nudix hydrolase 15, mitochondrial-like n=1 Tax=Actinidia eriantha TaxID=165200 RepID=UPI00258AC9E1|nr:nudix hydrolase 15, mitochondrial-like [Actinidia eriantha]
MACIATSPCIDCEMGCQTLENQDSEKLRCLANRLRCYQPPSVNGETENGIDQGINSTNNTRIMKPVEAKERRAAVLICLFEGTEGELRVILTKRSMNLSSHPGDVALPGGKMEEVDADDSATALREAMEEIGLDPALVEVVANLEPFISQHQLLVVPVVGLLPRIEDFKPLLNEDEVDAIFDAPLEMFLKEDSHRLEEREWRSRKYACHLFDFKSEQGAFLIGGLTANILIRAATIVYQRFPSFTTHLPDFQQLQNHLCNANA